MKNRLQKTALMQLPVKDLPPRMASRWETRWLTADRNSQCYWMGLSHNCTSIQLCHTRWTSFFL